MKSPTTSARDVAATKRTHVNACIGTGGRVRRVGDAVTRCGAGIRPALAGHTMCIGKNSKIRKRVMVERGYYDESRIHELAMIARIFVVVDTPT